MKTLAPDPGSIFVQAAELVFHFERYTCVVLGEFVTTNRERDLFFDYRDMFIHEQYESEFSWWDVHTPYTQQRRVLSLLLAAEMARTGDLQL